ncbi:CheR family methyltransferase [Roseateles sp. BYS180W]|uniref:Chemotaxis protein methyltransferase n=1 Tax=Roseateles rivi TaxID=3299028 RepID=A0ABW7FUC1_9BURK
MSQLSNQAFVAVTEFFEKVSGIRLADNKRALVEGRLQKLAQECGEDDINVFIQRVVRRDFDERVLVTVIDRLTTNETYFFREPQHYEDLTRRMERMHPQQDLQVWSAASSTGEEAYSVAMLMADRRPTSPWRIHGTDLSTSVVRTAQHGMYPVDRGSRLPAGYLKRFCLRGEGPYEGQLLVKRELRQRVNFRAANLMRDLPSDLPQFDVIFLRNVLIYFDPPAKMDIVRRVLTKLKQDGVLYIGHAESLTSLNLPLKMVENAVYQHA